MVNVNLYDATQPTRGAPARRRKREYLPAATAAANQVGVVLVKEFGQQGWILQAMEACREAVQNCIEMLSGAPAPTMNNQPLGAGGKYAFPARTAQELQASASEASHSGHVSQAHAAQAQLAAQADQAMANGELDMFAQLQQQANLADPASQGMPPQQPQQQETPDAGRNDWLL